MGPSLSVFCLFFFVCPSCYDARHRKPRRCVYALNLGGTGISPLDSFSYCSSFRFHSRSRSADKNLPGPGHPTSGDIFYCSGSRQLNHSSLVVAVSCVIVVMSLTVDGGWLLLEKCKSVLIVTDQLDCPVPV